MSNIKLSKRFIKSLKNKFGINFSDIDTTKLDFFSLNNIDKCPYILVKYKLELASKFPNSTTNLFCLVDETINLVISGTTNNETGVINLSITEPLYKL